MNLISINSKAHLISEHCPIEESQAQFEFFKPINGQLTYFDAIALF